MVKQNNDLKIVENDNLKRALEILGISKEEYESRKKQKKPLFEDIYLKQKAKAKESDDRKKIVDLIWAYGVVNQENNKNIKDIYKLFGLDYLCGMKIYTESNETSIPKKDSVDVDVDVNVIIKSYGIINNIVEKKRNQIPLTPDIDSAYKLMKSPLTRLELAFGSNNGYGLLNDIKRGTKIKPTIFKKIKIILKAYKMLKLYYESTIKKNIDENKEYKKCLEHIENLQYIYDEYDKRISDYNNDFSRIAIKPIKEDGTKISYVNKAENNDYCNLRKKAQIFYSQYNDETNTTKSNLYLYNIELSTGELFEVYSNEGLQSLFNYYLKQNSYVESIKNNLNIMDDRVLNEDKEQLVQKISNKNLNLMVQDFIDTLKKYCSHEGLKCYLGDIQLCDKGDKFYRIVKNPNMRLDLLINKVNEYFDNKKNNEER